MIEVSEAVVYIDQRDPNRAQVRWEGDARAVLPVTGAFIEDGSLDLVVARYGPLEVLGRCPHRADIFLYRRMLP